MTGEIKARRIFPNDSCIWSVPADATILEDGTSLSAARSGINGLWRDVQL
jgi:hypothetical protein